MLLLVTALITINGDVGGKTRTILFLLIVLTKIPRKVRRCWRGGSGDTTVDENMVVAW